MSHKIFRIFNPGGPKEDPIDKRRAQLRNAQRSYRDRKDKYTKALEREVAQIRANEAELMTRCEQLSATVQALTELLAQHGIMTPPTLEKNTNDGLSNKRRNPADVVTEDNLSQSSITSSTLCTSGLSHDTTMTTLTKTPAEVRSPFQTGYIGNADKPKPQSYRYSSEYHRLLKRSWSEIDQALLGSDNSRGRMCELDPTLVGMEFVLTIENPCLEHLGGNPSNPGEPTGHALTTSAQLLFSHSHSPKDHISVLPSYQHTPANLLHRLLNLSSDLCFEGELTPTQAWDYIRNRPQFGGIEVQRLRRLAENLKSAVKCHGFGAVIDVQTFENLVFEALMFAQDF